MVTYGKKKRPMLPSFSGPKDGKSKVKDKSKQTESLVQTPVLPSSHDEEVCDDNTKDLVDKLLEDTMEQSQPLPQRHLQRSKTYADLSRYAYSDKEKSLPQLPNMTYNQDSPWAMRKAAVVTSDGLANTRYFHGEEVSSMSKLPRTTSDKESAPPIPVKSSKRDSVKPKLDLESQSDTMTISSPTPGPENYSSPRQYANDDEIVQAMLEANHKLKGSTASQSLKANDSHGNLRGAREGMGSSKNQVLFQGPYVEPKKSGFNKVVTRVKTAFGNRLPGASGKGRRDPAGGDKSLDPFNSEMQEWKDMNSTDMRLNDSKNSKNSGHYKPTLQGSIIRKPVADNGKSLMSASSKRAGRSCSLKETRSPTNYENQHGDYMNLDRSTEFGAESMLLSFTSKKIQSGMPEQTNSVGDVDAMPSSSPQGQSTPRLRLEPYEENGRKTLRGVSIGSRSIFDARQDSQLSDMALDDEEIGVAITTEDAPKRKGSQELRSPMKRSKALLTKGYCSGDDEGSLTIPAIGDLLSSKDVNRTVKTGKGHMPGMLLGKKGLPSSPGSMPNLGANTLKSAMRKPAVRSNRQSDMRQNEVADGEMEIDELQWDNIDFYIGGKKS
ncbi:hypothetical protein N431DRAFT_170627 [Stipitochalara longipes BDJ]|nr:hypothetical protein N431DRAFT_170627 [Stipitochalara longipes BDJ]